MEILYPILIIALMSLVIWKSGEGFEAAADYLGRNLSNGVKGATINAVGSSLPELLTTLFFLFILNNADGFAAGLGTTAGSAIFNAAIIPFVVGMAVYFKFNKKSFTISRKVLLRDGLALIFVNFLLIFLINYGVNSKGELSLTWIEGGGLMVFYIFYLAFLFMRMDKSTKDTSPKNNNSDSFVAPRNKREIFHSLVSFKFEQAFVGNGEINATRAWLLLLFSMIIMSTACYGLAESSIMLGEALEIPIFIVSVVLAAAATSVPDTFLSYRDALKGNYDDSISNAFGSNVFDIGFAVGFPILLYGLININVSDGIVLKGIVLDDVLELLTLLLIITISIFVLFVTGSKITIWKLFVAFGLYLVFVFVVIAMTFNLEITNLISDFLLGLGKNISI